ncbi:signal peptidase I [Arthrobacter sp. StoSoilB20]|uniref:signal peptidase I n=1 Tax=Arthrobacter sp. StoSoilB20 TaxID=2830995 RepID=UPI0021E15F20|nr:signal peptidase I [Arthrobacter sp. StoSoilB20]
MKIYHVPSASMEQTLEIGDRVLVNRTAYFFSEPQRGDVVVFRKPASWGSSPEHGALRTAVGWFGDLTGIGPGNTEFLVKRVVGLPGDTVECCSDRGQVRVNGEAINEPYVFKDLAFEATAFDCSSQAISPRCFDPIRLDQGQYLLLGDHRSNSEDSVSGCRSADAAGACFKTAHRSDLVGTVDGFLYPFNKWGNDEYLTISHGGTQ